MDWSVKAPAFDRHLIYITSDPLQERPLFAFIDPTEGKQSQKT